MADSASTPLRRIDRLEEPPPDVLEELRRVHAAGPSPYPPATPELIATLAQAQADIDAGRGIDLEEFFRRHPE